MVARSYTLGELRHILWHRRWFVLLPLALGVAITPLLSRFVPEQYRSEALILVVPQRVPDTYVKSTVVETVEERLPGITDQILSRSRLETIIQEMGLYKEERAKDVMENVVQKMRADIATSAVGKDVNSFRVSYASANPEVARKVTERLASLYIDQNLKDRENQAVNTSQFLDTQLTEAKRSLVEQEKKLEEYRRTHAGQLPSQLPGNLQAIQNANVQLQGVNDAINRALEHRLLVERQISDLQATSEGDGPPPSASELPANATTQQQLDAARGRLTILLQRFTPDYPEVVALQRTVADLTTKLEGERPLGATPAAAAVSPAVAAQRKKVLDLQAELAVVDHQLSINRAEEARLKQTIASYQGKVDVVPTRESELVELTRDYSTMQAAYTNLLMKREESVIAANLERRQIGEQFKLLDSASLPGAPFNDRQRLTVLCSGAAAGLLLGLIAVFLLEYHDSSFRAEEEVMAALSIPVLALIPLIQSDHERLRQRRRTLAADVAGICVLASAAAIVVIWRLQS